MPSLVVLTEFNRIGSGLVIEGLRALGIRDLEEECFSNLFHLNYLHICAMGDGDRALNCDIRLTVWS